MVKGGRIHIEGNIEMLENLLAGLSIGGNIKVGPEAKLLSKVRITRKNNDNL